MDKKWTVQPAEHCEQTCAILAFLLDEYVRIFGSEIMFNEDCIVFNDPQASCPRLITNVTPVHIRLAQENLSYWTQTVFQLSHEMCHYAIRQHKENKEFTLSWFEEIVCEAMSLYALQYASSAWNRCSLAQYMPLFGQNHETYLTQELAKDSTSEFSQCDTIEKLLEHEKKEIPESQRESHRVERNFVYRAISSNPQDLRSVIDYTKYMNNNGVTINFEKWIHDDNSNLLRELRKIQPVKIESPIIV